MNFGLIFKKVYCSASTVGYFLSLASLSLSQVVFLDHSVLLSFYPFNFLQSILVTNDYAVSFIFTVSLPQQSVKNSEVQGIKAKSIVSLILYKLQILVFFCRKSFPPLSSVLFLLINVRGKIPQEGKAYLLFYLCFLLRATHF